MANKLKELKLLDRGVGAAQKHPVKYPGVRDAVDGNTAVIHVEREASDAAGRTRSRRRRRWGNTGRRRRRMGI